jgi:type I restriction enzyme S subunit
MPRTSWKDLAAQEVPWPGDNLVRHASQHFEQTRDTVSALLAESRTLAALRDTLLPALMSGKLRVRDAERQVEEVV